MPSVTLPYQIVPGEPYPVPLCDVFVLGPAGKVLVRSVIDSGAVRPIFPLKAAEDAGIILPAFANDAIQYGGSLTRSWRVTATVALAELRWNVEVSFVERLAFSYGLLGRRGVFAQFKEVRLIEKS